MDEKLLEQIWYDLAIQGDVLKENDYHRLLIVETLARLPQDIREKAFEEIMFIITSEGVCGTYFCLHFYEPKVQSFILLNFSELKGEDKPRVMSTIAHEIAHFILGHKTITLGSQSEDEADTLIEKWGFERAY